MVTPESLCFCSDGGVEYSGSSQTTDTQYLPPELQNAPVKTLQAAEKVSKVKKRMQIDIDITSSRIS